MLASAPAGAQDEAATAKAERRTFTIELVPLEQVAPVPIEDGGMLVVAGTF